MAGPRHAGFQSEVSPAFSREAAGFAAWQWHPRPLHKRISLRPVGCPAISHRSFASRVPRGSWAAPAPRSWLPGGEAPPFSSERLQPFRPLGPRGSRSASPVGGVLQHPHQCPSKHGSLKILMTCDVCIFVFVVCVLWGVTSKKPLPHASSGSYHRGFRLKMARFWLFKNIYLFI